MEQTLLKVDGGQVDYIWLNQNSSNEDKPVLVFLHEGLGCIRLWKDFPERLCKLLGLRGFVYSRFGYGNSDPCDLPRPLSYMHDEGREVLPSVLHQAGIENFILIGHSDGGSIALVYAGSVEHTGLKGLVTLAGHVFSEEQYGTEFEQAHQAYLKGDLKDKLRKYHGDNVDCAYYGWHGAWSDPEFAFWNLEEFLGSIKVPSLVLQGDNDRFSSNAQVEAIVKGIGDRAKKHIIKDCGHSPHIEQPDETLDQIVGFIRSIS